MQLPPDLIARLKDQGVTHHWLAEQTGQTPLQASRLLRSLGASQIGHRGAFKLPNLQRMASAEARLKGDHSGTGRNNGDGLRRHGRRA